MSEGMPALESVMSASEKCPACRKKKPKHVFPCGNLTPHDAVEVGGPLTCMVSRARGANQERVYIAWRCEDWPCILSVWHSAAVQYARARFMKDERERKNKRKRSRRKSTKK